LQTKGYVDNSVSLPRELPSVEEALKMIAGALKAAIKPGLDRVEVQRLQTVASIAKTYQELLADYINYREIETKLIEMEEKYAILVKEKNDK
jgi:Tfp pilus assembly protein PilO